MLDPKKLSATALSLTQTAVVEVLRKNFPTCIGAAELSRQAGLPVGKGPAGFLNEALAHAALNALFGDGKVEQCKQPGKTGKAAGGWKLTDKYAKKLGCVI